MNTKFLRLCITFILFVSSLFGQTAPLLIADAVVLPRDTSVSAKLVAALHDFLLQTGKPNSENTLVLPDDLPAMSALLDEMKDLEKEMRRKDTIFYKPYLTNLVCLSDTQYLAQIAYMGLIKENPALRASFTFCIRKREGRFCFYAPLQHNTASWKKQVIGSATVYYKEVLDKAKAMAYFKMVADYDKKLDAPVTPADFYCADNFHEVLQLIGVDYKSDYNGYARNSITVKEKGKMLTVNGVLTSGFREFDPHDLWHARLHQVIPVSIINRPVDEGTAYLYGGSWGLSWAEIVTRFMTFVKANPGADWLSLYNESRNFDEKGKFPLSVDFMINALLVQKIEREKGFAAVKELLSCGKKEDGNEHYFTALEKITGISKAGFNKEIQALIDAAPNPH